MKTEKNAIGQLQKAYDSLAWMNLTAHLYDLTEGVRDGRYGMDGNLLDKDTDDCYGQLLGHIRDYAEAGENARERILKALPKLREHVTERAEQVQVFSDALMIYEYLFNRAEYSFRTYDKPFDNEEEAKEILRAVFRSEDSAETNLRIQIMLSQLPVRLTKSRFFDLVRGAFSIYGNSDTEALSGFRYRIVSAAALLKQSDDRAFSEYRRLTERLSEVSFDDLTEDECNEWEDCVSDAADSLKTSTDYLSGLQDCINAFYTVVLLDAGYEDTETKGYMLPATGAVADFGFALLAGRNEALAEGSLGPAFAYMEGKLEPLSERVLKDEAKIDAYCENDAEFKNSEEGKTVLLAKRLMSTSSFAPLSEQETVMVDEAVLNRETDEVITLLEESLKGRSKTYNRAVMAAVLKELPVFFNSHTEVMNYVLHSLKNCSAEWEKRGAVEMFRRMLEGAEQE